MERRMQDIVSKISKNRFPIQSFTYSRRRNEIKVEEDGTVLFSFRKNIESLYSF